MIKDYLSGVLGNFVIIRFVTREICCFGYRKTSFEERIEQLQFRQREDREKSISYETELWFYYTEKSTGAFFDK